MVASTTGAGATTVLRLADQKSIFGLVANALAITTATTSARRRSAAPPPCAACGVADTCLRPGRLLCSQAS